jgi:archaellum component FlaC
VSAKADKVVSSKITEMKQTIEVLEEEKEQLVEQVTVMQNEIITIKSAPVQQPFDVLAIVPDSADRK